MTWRQWMLKTSEEAWETFWLAIGTVALFGLLFIAICLVQEAARQIGWRLL